MAKADTKVWLNGSPADSISALDRGLAYGHGLFETMRMVSGRPVLWDYHWQRLAFGCTRLGIDLPDDFEASLLMDLRLVPPDSTYMAKIMVTAGVGGVGYRMPASISPQRLLLVTPLADYPAHYYDKGIQVKTAEVRLGTQPLLAGVKHLNRLEQVLASKALTDNAVQELIMLDQQGYVIEGTRTNIFGVDERGHLYTPSLERSGVAGVMRRFLIEQARALQLTVHETDVSLAGWQSMNELFVCNSVLGIWPIREWDNRCYPVGELTRVLSGRVAALMDPQPGRSA